MTITAGVTGSGVGDGDGDGVGDGERLDNDNNNGFFSARKNFISCLSDQETLACKLFM